MSSLEKLMQENASEIDYSNKAFSNVKFHVGFRHGSFVDGNTLINSQFQVWTSLLLCIIGSIGGLFHLGILIRRYFQIHSIAKRILIQLLFDCCHLFNIVFTHVIVIVVYIRTSTNFEVNCPLSMLFVSLPSFASIAFLCLEAFHRYMFLFRQQIHHRTIHHRSMAHRFILITSISWLILHFPKIDLNKYL